MALIYTASGDTQSAQHSSRIVVPIIKWVFPDISWHGIEKIIFLSRKCAHLTVYAVLAILLWVALLGTLELKTRQWSWKPVTLILGAIFIYAASDELHQTFVPSRQGTISDVLIDTTGAAIGLFLIWAIGKWRKKW